MLQDEFRHGIPLNVETNKIAEGMLINIITCAKEIEILLQNLRRQKQRCYTVGSD